MKILVADDAPLIRGRLARMLADIPGIGPVLQSVDYADTLGTIAQERPDAVLLDLFMPGGTGLELLREIGHDHNRPRVIMMTAWSDTDMRGRCLDAGAEYFFEKGAQIIEAIDVVRDMVSHWHGNDDAALTPSASAASAASVSDNDPHRAEPRPSAVEACAGQGLSVLVVEDHAFQRKVLVGMVRSLGAADVLEACDGEQALTLLQTAERPPQLIICDLDMPRMDGMEFMRHLGERGSDAAVVITSAVDASLLNSVQMMCHAYGVRMLGVIEKPIDTERLRAIMAKASAPQLPAVSTTRDADPAFGLEQIYDGLRDDQFEPFFQPKVDMRSGRIVGAEALARWRHPELGVIAPFAFVAQLEQSGNIDQLTFRMLQKAAQACCGWRRQGLDLTVSVNLSLASLGDTRLAERIDACVRETGLESRYLTLEITETAAMTNVGQALENLARLRMRGFGLSIDDFGTGFASMQQLGRVAFSELKIDRCFVAAMQEKREARAIVESSIDMARRLGITAVAEGIETHGEWEAIKAAGCKLAQGYFISRPVDGAQFVELCAKPIA